jgi:hypothetical protein
MAKLAFDDVAGYPGHGLGEIVKELLLLSVAHETKEVAGLGMVVVPLSVIVAVGIA